MATVPDIQYRAPAARATFKPIRDAIAGEPGYEVKMYPNHATEYGLRVRNLGAGPVADFRNAAGTTMLEVTQTGVTVGGTVSLSSVSLTTLAVTGNETVGGTLGVTGTVTGGNLVSNAGISGVSGSFSSTLGVTGILTAGAAINASGTITGANLVSNAGISGVNAAFSGTLGVTGRASFASGTQALPGIYFTAAGAFGLHYSAGSGTGLVGFGTGATDQTVQVGIGTPTGLLDIVQLNAAPRPGIYVASGALGNPKVPTGAPIHADQVLNLSGGTYPAIEAATYATDGTTGYAVGIKGTAEGRNDSTGLVALMGHARSTITASSQAVTGLLINSTGVKNGDHVQGAEIVVGTRSDGTPSQPDQRIGVIIGTIDGAHSIRANPAGGVDTHILLTRKAVGGDVTNVQTWRSGILMGSHAGGADGWPLGDDSTIVGCDTTFAVNAANQTGYVVDLANTHVREAIIGSSTSGASTIDGVISLAGSTIIAGGQILKIGGGGSDPAINILAAADAIGAQVGWVGIGVVPTRPLHIKTAETEVMRFDGTTANFTDAAAGASAGVYLRIMVGSTVYKLELLADS